MENNEKIKKVNRKALPKFILVLVVAAVAGGFFGYFSTGMDIEAMAAALKSAGYFFSAKIAPWLLLGLAVILPAVCLPLYIEAKKLLKNWDGEDESVSDLAEKYISMVIWASGAALIVSFFLISAVYSSGLVKGEDIGSVLRFFLAVAGFVAIMAETLLFQQKSVDATKITNPEKENTSYYDMKFQKKWLDSCDEAEKILIGKCAYKAFGATNIACTVLSVVLTLAALTFEISFIPSLSVCIIWLVNQTVYCKEALKYTKAGQKIS